MKCYSLAHLSDGALRHDLAAAIARDRASTAELLAHIAEFDARKLYRPAGYPSMHAYCVGELRLSEDAASKRIHAARAARQFPAIFPALADGRLHLTGVGMLAAHLTRENADALLTAAAKKTKAEIELLLAQHFPRPDVPAQVRAIAPVVAPPAPGQVGVIAGQHAPAHVGPLAGQHAPAHVGASAPRDRVAPLSPGRFAVQFTLGQDGFDLLGYAQALLGHTTPSHDVAQVFERALRELVQKLERRKFAAAVRTRPGRHSQNPRYVPAAVRSAVWQRDGGQCTFVSASGHRCECRTRLELDHIDPVARGGQASVSGVRLMCRAHNQYAAECAFGSDFMRRKREAARERAAERRATAQARDAAPAHALTPAQGAAPAHNAAPASVQQTPAAEPDPDRDVVPWLRKLGFRMEEARRAAELCECRPDASLEERVRLALSSLAPVSARRSDHITGSAA
jgi:hypothetical protein